MLGIRLIPFGCIAYFQVLLLMDKIRLTTKDDNYPIIYRVWAPSQVVVWDFVHQQYLSFREGLGLICFPNKKRINFGRPQKTVRTEGVTGYRTQASKADGSDQR